MVGGRWAAVLAVGVGLAASGAVLGQSLGGAPASPDGSVTTSTTATPMGEMVVRAADRAALVQLCLDGLGDAEANADYQQARAAHPRLAEGIGPDCRVEPVSR